ncbi:MAG TPA: regulatory protein RecX [Candidatus Krumholzibacteria bacterium]|nr:regulatory protein RecX [Candidatus Krumholzibacteria bacterium]
MDAEIPNGAAVLSVVADEERRALVIELDDGSTLITAPDAPEARGITPGLVLSDAQRRGLDAAAARKEIARKVFDWLDRRPRCRADLRRRLRDRDHEPEAIEIVLDRFEEQGLVDDRAYARAWAEQAVRRKGVGRRWIEARLRQQGVDASLAREASGIVLDPESELEQARRALASRRLDLDDERQRQRALRFLQQRGFGGATARAALAADPDAPGAVE